MRYKLWLYKDGSNLNNLVVQDTSIATHCKGGYMLRSQSIYPEDKGKLVWKNAAYPISVHFAIKENEGICIAEAMHISTLDANMNWRVLDYLWRNCNEK
ncbi:hypothetical protein Erwinia_phage_Mauresque_00056 [Erwinia phage Mauresque]|nr:hypothetical protein Erwinia_phage_Mauresque_00056 [Erwinia phage Mauresque]